MRGPSADMARSAMRRHGLAAALGVAAVSLGLIGLDVHPLVSVAVGAVVYAGTLLMTLSSNPFRSLTKRNEFGQAPAFMTAEVQQARDRIRSIRRISSGMATSQIGDSIGAIADSADAIIADLGRNPGDYRRLRKALVHYLPHVETIADRIAYMQGVGPIDPEIRGRAEQTLVDMQRLFVEYQRRMLADETFDLDARIALLEQEVRREGVVRPGSTRPASQ